LHYQPRRVTQADEGGQPFAHQAAAGFEGGAAMRDRLGDAAAQLVDGAVIADRETALGDVPLGRRAGKTGRSRFILLRVRPDRRSCRQELSHRCSTQFSKRLPKDARRLPARVLTPVFYARRETSHVVRRFRVQRFSSVNQIGPHAS
jgi:hypothetical protein